MREDPEVRSAPGCGGRPEATDGPALIVLCGPTAAGKSAAAVALAERVDGEIVNADSMATYIGMEIGTAKPTPAERRGIGHHCYDIWTVRQPAAVAEYSRLVRARSGEIQARGRVPILVGGSGLYVRAIVDDIAFPGTDPAIRMRLERDLAESGPESLHARLSAADPVAAASILPRNGRRIVRALEVIELSGRPFSATMPAYDARPDVVQIALDRPDLDDRVQARVDAMWRRGLVDEVRMLERQGLREGPTASRAHGYAQVLAMFDGEYDAAGARAATVRATRRFARRQRSWFRRDPRLHWIDSSTDPVPAALRLIERPATLDP